MLFAIYALVKTRLHLNKLHRDQTTTEFITGRGTAPKWRIAWSFFASAVGAWVITAPSAFAVFTGIVGLAMYALSAGEEHPDSARSTGL